MQRAIVLGIVDRGSRRLLRLRALPRKCAWTLLGHLCFAIAAFGRPRTIRTPYASHAWRNTVPLG